MIETQGTSSDPIAKRPLIHKSALRSWWVSASIFILLVWGTCSVTQACHCEVPTPVEALVTAGAVFSGEVRTVTIIPDGVHTDIDLYVSEVIVEECWKGPYAPGDTVDVYTLEPYIGVCGYPFYPGVKYIVFGGSASGHFSTSICDPTTSAVEWATDQLGPPGCSTRVESITWSRVRRVFK